MKRYPEQESVTKCINLGCPQLPTGLICGEVPKGYGQYQVQVLHCSDPDHIKEAEVFFQQKHPRVSFEDWKNPTWLKKAQTEEIKRRGQA